VDGKPVRAAMTDLPSLGVGSRAFKDNCQLVFGDTQTDPLSLGVHSPKCPTSHRTPVRRVRILPTERFNKSRMRMVLREYTTPE